MGAILNSLDEEPYM